MISYTDDVIGISLGLLNVNSTDEADVPTFLDRCVGVSHLTGSLFEGQYSDHSAMATTNV